MLYTVVSMKLPKSNAAASHRTLRLVGFVLTTATVAYGLVVAAGDLPSQAPSFNFDLSVVAGIGLAWLVYSAWLLLRSAKSRPSQAASKLLLLVYIGFATIYLLLSAVDFASPVVYLWSLLIAGSYLMAGRFGYFASLTALVLALSLSLALNTSASASSIEVLLSALIVATLGTVFIAMVRSSEADQVKASQPDEQGSLQQDRTLTLVNNLADAVISTDRYGTITLYNAAALNLLDTNANILGENIDRVLKTMDVEGSDLSCWEILRQASTVTTRDDIFIQDGDQQTRLEMTFSPIRGNYSDGDSSETYELGGYVIILRDITKSKSLEEERDEFISVVSHELRTPITIAEGTLSNVSLMMGHGKTPKERLHDAVKIAHEQVIFLARMVNDLSTLSRAERGVADEAEEIDVDEMIHDIYNEHREEAAAKELSLDLNLAGKAGSVMASRLYLKELLQNFVTNAIKYTEKGGVTIKMRKSDDIVTISVTDTGIGISKSDQRRIFNKFYRAEDYRTRETNGTGLGLYVAEKLARKLNTTIDVTSRLNHGSTFSIDLPTIDKVAKPDPSSQA